MELRRGQVAVVTGGASGIGLALAESLAQGEDEEGVDRSRLALQNATEPG